MHPALEGFLARPLSHRIGAWAGSVVVIGFVFWQFFYKENARQLTEISDKIESLNTQITEKRRIARNLEKFRAEVKDLEIKLKYALQELPDKREIPDLLSSISNLARDAGLEVTLFKPAPEVFRDFYAEVPVSMSVEGAYHQVATFFDEVGHLSRIVNLNQIVVREPKTTEAKVRVKTDCTATTFRYLDESERLQISKKDDPKKRRKK